MLGSGHHRVEHTEKAAVGDGEMQPSQRALFIFHQMCANTFLPGGLFLIKKLSVMGP